MEPVAALVAVLAVGAGLSLYAGVLGDLPTGSERRVAPLAAERVADAASSGGVLDPSALRGAAEAATPQGLALNATLAAGGRRWTAGPPLPAATGRKNGTAAGAADPSPDRETVRRSVRLAPGRIRPGSLRVVVW